MPRWAQAFKHSVLGTSNAGIVLVMVVALALRLYSLDWDGGRMFHPDERHILMVTNGIKVPSPLTLDVLLSRESTLNPKSFAYGSFIFYFLSGTAYLLDGLANLGGPFTALKGVTTYGEMRIVGRAFSSIFDSLTILLTFLIATRLYNRRVAFLAATFVAFSVLHIQLSHFYASDTPMTFFVTLTFLFATHHLLAGTRRSLLWAGVAAGLAVACKVSSLPILAAVVAAPTLRLLFIEQQPGGPATWRGLRVPSAERVRQIALLFGSALGLLLVTFAIFEPYAFIDAKLFVTNVFEQNNMVRGASDLPYTRQYASRTAYLYFIENLTVFGLGIPLGIAAFAGWLLVIARNIARPNPRDLLILSFVVPYFLITGGFHAKFLRYMLPITPLLAIMAAVLFDRLLVWLKAWDDRGRASVDWSASPVGAGNGAAESTMASRFDDATTRPTQNTGGPREWLRTAQRRGYGTRFGLALLAVSLAVTLFNAIAFLNIYSAPHPAIAASQWIYDNVPRNARLATEHWEEGMPVAVRKPDGKIVDAGQMGFKNQSLNLYEADDARKIANISQVLSQTDYIIFFSNRLYGTIPRLPARYPVTTRYYELLFGEQLGFELVGAFTSYPGFFGISLVDDTFSDPGLPTPRLLQEYQPSPVTINLGRADESFTVYDHPKVLIFQKVRPVTEAEVRAQLEPALVRNGPIVGPRGQVFKSLLLDEEARATQTAGGTFTELFNPDDLLNAFPLIPWVVLIAVLGVIGWPIAFAIFRFLPDRGAALARTLAVLATTWVVWVTVSVGVAPATRAWTYVGLVLVGLVSAAVAYRQRAALVAFIRLNWRLLTITELVFWTAFVFFLLIRLANPDLWHAARGGEKPMDIAYLMAAIKSTSYPPYDPWFAGGYLNYYYFGQVTVATLIKLTGVVPTTSYNLVVPFLYAITVSGTFGVAYALARRLVPSAKRAYGAAISAALFVTTLGNLGAGGQLIGDVMRIGAVDYKSLIPGLPYVAQFLAGMVNWLVGGRAVPINTDWYWGTTRIIQGTINEFPYFTFLYADLHAHMIALPFTLLALAFAVDIVRSRGQYTPPMALRAAFARNDRLGFAAPAVLPRPFDALPRLEVLARLRASTLPEDALRLVLTGMAIGVLMPMNSWDFPTYLGVISLAGLIPWYLAERRDTRLLASTLVRIGAVAVLSYLLFLPFHQSYQSFYSGVRLTPDKADLGGYLVIHGLFLAAIITFLIFDVRARLGRAAAPRVVGHLLRFWDRPLHYFGLYRRLVRRVSDAGVLLVYGALALVLLAALLVVIGWATVAFLMLLLVPVAALALRRDRLGEEALLYVLIGTGLALGIVSEVVEIDGAMRMNTVFKFYLQVWVMWGIVAAVALWSVRDRLRGIRDAGARRLWIGLLVVLFLSAATYPIVATRARVNDRFNTQIGPTLDGTAYMATAVYRDQNRDLVFSRDRAALDWMLRNVPGSPVVLEGNTPLYRWGSRVSIYTGLPSVIGWDWHQKQQRAGYVAAVDDRLRDVKTMFGDPSPERTVPLLQKYNVRYIYVGDLERAYYPAEGLAKFDRMVGNELDVVYDADGVKIYRVRETPA